MAEHFKSGRPQQHPGHESVGGQAGERWYYTRTTRRKKVIFKLKTLASRGMNIELKFINSSRAHVSNNMCIIERVHCEHLILALRLIHPTDEGVIPETSRIN